jgi:small subunit ribosomal protein S16
MSVKIRLQRKGRRKAPFYHIVIADARAPRDGKYIEKIGTYNPMTKPATVELDADTAFSWMEKGAQPTETVRSILRFKGVLYKKHLQRGVKKGALTQEQADTKLAAWIEAKEANIAERKAASIQERLAYHAKVNGIAPPKVEPKVEEVVVEAPAPEATEEAVADAPAEGGEA